MNIIVIGAGGGIGKQAVVQALESSHRVIAILRSPAKLMIEHVNLTIVKGDVLDQELLERFLPGTDAVISAIGEPKDRPTSLYSDGAVTLLAAMKNTGVSRAFFISAQAIEISPAQPFFIRLITKYIVQKLFSHGYTDQRIMERAIRSGDLQWTIMRPPRLTNAPSKGTYRFAVNDYLKNCMKISRGDVAHFMVHHLEDPATYRAVIELAY